MNTLTYLIFLAVLGVVAFFKGGPNSGTFQVFLAAAALGAIPWYFGTRDRTKPPSFAEKVFATLWVWLRRLLGFTVGGFCIVGAYFMATSNPGGKSQSSLWLGSLALAVFGGVVVYLGVFGQGTNKYDFRDDISLHSENKKRYRWWF
jgi:hypothetical protein